MADWLTECGTTTRPEAERCGLRTLLRHRGQLIEHRAPHILHMQKVLQQMNLPLHRVLSDITGVTGMQILRAIVAGERDPKVLAALRHPSYKTDEGTIIKALTGTWADEHLFALNQALQLFDFFTRQLAACDAQVEQRFAPIKPRWDAPDAALLTPSQSQLQIQKQTRQPSFAFFFSLLFRTMSSDVHY